ncbi:MAG: helix-turn-helix domain-containing protein [Ramlibacter sp.]
MSEAATAGALLRQAREAAGLHVASLAVALKVPVRKLEALERDQYDQLPDAVFARALASSVCRTLKIDPQPVLERLPQTHAPRLVQDQDGLNAPFRAPGDSAAPGWIDHLNKPMVLAVFALLLGALVLVFLPTVRRDETAATPAAATTDAPLTAPALPAAGPATEQPVAASPDTVPVPQPSESTAVVPVASVGPAAAASGPAHAAAAAQKSAVAASAAAPRSNPASAANAAAPASAPLAAASAPLATGVVVFKTTGPSWIEVTDSRGGVALRRLMAAGETAGASGNLPLSVTVGSVNATSVQVRGKPYNLAPVSRDNVARFEVK